MAELSPKIKEKKAAKWEAALQPHLLKGEVIWAFLSASRFKPQSEATAITNARILGFSSFAMKAEKTIVYSTSADDIQRVDTSERRGQINLVVHTHSGEVNFGAMHKDEIQFAQHYIGYLQSSGMPEAVAQGLIDDQRQAAHASEEDAFRRAQRDSVPVFGEVMKERQWDNILDHAHGSELPWLVLNGGMAGQLAAFEDRLIIAKKGGMAGFMAGSMGGGRVTTFPFREITNIEYNGGFVNGVLEVLTPSYQGTGNHDFWRSSDKSRNKASDDPWTLSNCLPFPKASYNTALPKINELQRRIIEAKQTVIVHNTPSVTPTKGESGGLSEELGRLADLHQRGLLDDEEFKAAKQAAIARGV
ncbi:MAG: SHOCT domain-containing protein [Gordonia paraffinivorans]